MAVSGIPKGLEKIEELRTWRLNNVYSEVALLHKSGEGRSSPFPIRT